jgi:hypothetical protein
MTKLKDVIDTLDKAADSFDGIANKEQKKIYDEVITLAKDLDTDMFGKVKQSIANLKRLTQIKARLAALSKDKEWVAGISGFAAYFGQLQKLQNAYYSEHFPEHTLSMAAKEKNNLMRQMAVQNTMEALMGDGLKANVTDKLNDILLRAVTSGAKFADLQEELRAHLMGKDGGQGAFARYATTYATTALSQYTGQHNKLVSDGLKNDWFMYTGSNIETTREFCQHLTAKKYIHKSEIPEILKGKIEYDGEVHECAIYPKTGLPYGMIEGTTPENFQCNCGGWNCRHQLVPVADAVVPKAIRDRLRFAQKTHQQIQEYDEHGKPLDLPTTKGKLLAAGPGTALVITGYEQLRTAVQSIYEAKSNREQVNILRSITSASEYHPIKGVSSKNGAVYGYSAEQYDYKTENELPKNIHLASKMAKDGFDVWLVPNIGGSASADYIVCERGTDHYYYMEGKTTSGRRGIENAIANGEHQSGRIVIDVQIQMRPSDIAKKVQDAFIGYKTLKEVWLYKGSRRFVVRRQWAESRNFLQEFEKQWSKTK